MIYSRILTSFSLISLVLLSACSKAPAPEEKAPASLTPEEARQERIAWWKDARFGMFIHWGLYAIPGGTWKDVVKKRGYSEWIMFGQKIPREEYAALAKEFNPEQFDADEWVRIAKSAGMKYIVITAKHHDGFAMFDSKVTDYDIMDATPFKRDVIKELEEACHRAGLHFGIYYSVDRDWYRPTGAGNRYQQTNTWDFPDSTQADFDTYFEEIAFPQVKELITQYDIDLLWFDAIEMKSPDQIERLYNAIRKLSPDTIINSRIWSPRFPEEVPPPYCDYISSGDNKILENDIHFEWENPGSMNTSYGYNPNDHNWVEPGEIIRRLADIVSKGGNYLLNVGPDAEGIIPEPNVTRFAEVGKWMEVNGEAIYGASAWQAVHEDPDTYYTTKDNVIYAICTDWPGDGIILSTLNKQEQSDLTIHSIKLLGSDLEIEWNHTQMGVQLPVPAELPYPHALVYKITVE